MITQNDTPEYHEVDLTTWWKYILPVEGALRSLVIDEAGVELTIPEDIASLTVTRGTGDVSVLALGNVDSIQLEPFSDGFTGEVLGNVGTLSAHDSWRLEFEAEGSLDYFEGRLLNDADVEVDNALGGADIQDSGDVNINTEVAYDGDFDFNDVDGLKFETDLLSFANFDTDGITDLTFEANAVFVSDLRVDDSDTVSIEIGDLVLSDLLVEDTEGVTVEIEQSFESDLVFEDVENGGVLVEEGDVNADLLGVEQFVFRSSGADDRLTIFDGEQVAANTGDGDDRIHLHDVDEGVINASDGDDDIHGSGELSDVVLQGGDGADRFDLSGWIEGDIALDFKPGEDTGEVGFREFDIALELLYAVADREDGSGFVQLDEERSLEFTRFDEFEAVNFLVFADDAMGSGGKG